MIFLVSLILLLAALPASALDAATRRFTLPASTTGLMTALDFSGSGFAEDCTSVPCAAVFIVTSAQAEDTHAADAVLSIGFTDGNVQVNSRAFEDNGVGTTAGRRDHSNSRVITTQDSEAGGVTGVAIFYQWTSTGLQLEVTDDFPLAYYVTVTIMGGEGFSAKAGQLLSNVAVDGTTDVNTIGFEPDAVLLSTNRLGTLNTGSTTYVWSMGVAISDVSSSQGSISCYSQYGQTIADARALTSTTYALQTITGSGATLAMQLGSWDAQGFTATTKVSGIAAYSNYLALKFGGPNSAVLDIDTRTSTGLSSHALGWKPLVGFIFGTLGQAYDAVESDTDGGQCMITSFTDSNQYANNVSVRDAAETAMVNYSVSNDQGITLEANDGTCSAGSCFRGHTFVEATSMDINYTSVFSGAVRKWIGFAIEDTTEVPARRRGPGLLQ